MSSTKLSSILISTGATIAILIGMRHLYVGFPMISATLAETGASSIHWANLLQAMWIIFSIHLFMISALFLHSMWKQKALPTMAVIFCGLLPILDGAVLASFAPLVNLGLGIPGFFFILGGLLAAQPPQEGGETTRPFRALLSRLGKGFQSFTNHSATTLPAESHS